MTRGSHCQICGEIGTAQEVVPVRSIHSVFYDAADNSGYAHSSMLADVDDERSGKWRGLWKWYLATILGLFGGSLVMLLVPILGVIIVLAAAIGAIVVSIVKLVYLYQTAKRFQPIPLENEEE